MEYNGDKFINQKGVTLVELLVVILVLVIVSTIAIMNMGSSKIQLERQTVARELKVAFERARFDSVKRRAVSSERASVVVGDNSFTLKTDIDQDGTVEASEDRVNTSWNPSISVCDEDGVALSPDVTVEFNNRGETITTGGAATFLVCNGDCSTPSSSNSNLVIVTATGTVNILSGGATIPTFTAPSVTTVETNANIRSTVVVD